MFIFLTPRLKPVAAEKPDNRLRHSIRMDTAAASGRERRYFGGSREGHTRRLIGGVPLLYSERREGNGSENSGQRTGGPKCVELSNCRELVNVPLSHDFFCPIKLYCFPEKQSAGKEKGAFRYRNQLSPQFFFPSWLYNYLNSSLTASIE